MILQQLADHAEKRVMEAEKKCSLEEMKNKAFSMEKGEFLFEKALKNQVPAFICEVKKASPSKGVISPDFLYLNVAKNYQESGATCLSVLTEPKWFLGSDEIFSEIRQEVQLPMLRKDFTVSEYQIYESKVLGADCILLICSILDKKTVQSWINICDQLGLSVLVETHDAEEIKWALESGARILGVNNRNLKDFTVNLQNASDLKKLVPDEVVFVAESGISSPEDGIKLIQDGANALLIGEALMRTDNVELFLSKITTGSNV